MNRDVSAIEPLLLERKKITPIHKMRGA